MKHPILSNEELLSKIEEPTGYYDRTGRAIFDGYRIRGTFISSIVKGYVKKIDDEWFLIVDECDFVKENFNLELRYVQYMYILESDVE